MRPVTPDVHDPRLAVGITAKGHVSAQRTEAAGRRLSLRRAKRLMGSVFREALDKGMHGDHRQSDPFLGMEVIGEVGVDERTGRINQDWDMSGALVSGEILCAAARAACSVAWTALQARMSKRSTLVADPKG